MPKPNASWGVAQNLSASFRRGGAVALAAQIRDWFPQPGRRRAPGLCQCARHVEIPALCLRDAKWRLNTVKIESVLSVVTADSVANQAPSDRVTGATTICNCGCRSIFWEAVCSLGFTHPAGDAFPPGIGSLRMSDLLKEKAMSNPDSVKYYDLHTTGLGYLNRVREVTPKEENLFAAVSIAALRGSVDDVRYTHVECRVSGQQAQKLMRQLKPAVEGRPRCSWDSRSAICLLSPSPSRAATRPAKPVSVSRRVCFASVGRKWMVNRSTPSKLLNVTQDRMIHSSGLTSTHREPLPTGRSPHLCKETCRVLSELNGCLRTRRPVCRSETFATQCRESNPW